MTDVDFIIALVITVGYLILRFVFWMGSQDKRFVKSREIVVGIVIGTGIILWIFLLSSFWILFLGLAYLALFYLFYYATFRLKERYKGMGDSLYTFNIIEHGIPRRPFALRLDVFKDSAERDQDIYRAFMTNINQCPTEERNEYKKLITGLEGFTLNVHYVNFNYILSHRIRRYLKIYMFYLSPSQQRFVQYNKMLDDLWNAGALDEDQYAILEAALKQYATTIETLAPSVTEIVPEDITINGVQLKDEIIDGCKYAVLMALQGPRDEELMQMIYRLKNAFENVKTFPKMEEIRLKQVELDDASATIEWLWGELEKMKKFKSGTQDRYNRLKDEED